MARPPNILVVLSGFPLVAPPEFRAAQVFNLDADPRELHDLSSDLPLARRLDAELRSLLDPGVTNARAKSDQAARMAAPTASRG